MPFSQYQPKCNLAPAHQMSEHPIWWRSFSSSAKRSRRSSTDSSFSCSTSASIAMATTSTMVGKPSMETLGPRESDKETVIHNDDKESMTRTESHSRLSRATAEAKERAKSNLRLVRFDIFQNANKRTQRLIDDTLDLLSRASYMQKRERISRVVAAYAEREKARPQISSPIMIMDSDGTWQTKCNNQASKNIKQMAAEVIPTLQQLSALAPCLTRGAGLEIVREIDEIAELIAKVREGVRKAVIDGAVGHEPNQYSHHQSSSATYGNAFRTQFA
ncbi:hypothetical protein K431DRAFT_38799 [Polychaeton citri CBS 116435]|uniref:Uncharacterized protein n=1 Tax=Polychaeton citri CBS 116435 TaxID=1314669 RepID=A0A9P4UNV0_9PEZI|nr:hypothetical protein K431DRAFT_38799 [Polychaeton citri CBS 116435]